MRLQYDDLLFRARPNIKDEMVLLTVGNYLDAIWSLESP